MIEETCRCRVRLRLNRLATIITQPGEENKTLETVRFIYDQLLEAGMDRRGTLITLGGGVVGDMGGFAAATYMRGIKLVQCPTSLLAMVDAMHPLSRLTDAQVIQILGGVGNPGTEVHAARLTGRLATLVNGRATFLPAPGVVGSADS